VMELCIGPSQNVQLLNVLLNALTVIFTAWLAHRRLMADRRERNGNGETHHSNGGHGKQKADGPTNHPPGIQP